MWNEAENISPSIWTLTVNQTLVWSNTIHQNRALFSCIFRYKTLSIYPCVVSFSGEEWGVPGDLAPSSIPSCSLQTTTHSNCSRSEMRWGAHPISNPLWVSRALYLSLCSWLGSTLLTYQPHPLLSCFWPELDHITWYYHFYFSIMVLLLLHLNCQFKAFIL